MNHRIEQMLKRGLLVMLLLFATPAVALEWEDLSDAQQRLLSDYEAEWQALPETRQLRLALGAER